MSEITTVSVTPEEEQQGSTRGAKARKSKGKPRSTNGEQGDGDIRDKGDKGKRKRTQNACTTCRQQKLRCDGSIKFPAPCSRCADHGLPCRVDPTFKRTPARQRLEQVSRQLEHMREKLELRAAQPGEEIPDLESQPKFNDAQTAPIFPVVESSLLPKRIGDIELSLDAIVSLFHEFHSYYHPHLPIVNATVPLESIFVESPLLFNTILHVACRHHPTYSNLYNLLLPPLNTLIAEFSINPNTPGIDKNIQALLLLCSWPPPFVKQAEDVSWLRCGIATHLALQNGFHRPGFTQEFKEQRFTKDELQGRTLAWLACFLADFSLSSKLGLPATVVPDFTIRNPPSGLSKTFKHHLQIARVCSKFITALSGDQFSITGLAEASSRWLLIQLFDGELEALETQISQATPPCPLAAETEILFLTHRLHLHTYILHEDIQNIVGTFETSGVMIKGFRTAVKLIDAISNEQKRDVLKFYPTYIVRSLVTSSLWLLKLMAVSDARKSAQSSDNLTDPNYPTVPVALLDTKSIEIAQNHIREAFTILVGFSVAERDESQRAARFLEAIGGDRGDGKTGGAGWGYAVRMKSRMGSGLYYDAIWEKKERAKLSSAKDTPPEICVTSDPGNEKDVHNKVAPSDMGVESEWSQADLDSMPVDQGFWGMVGDLDGFSSWDNWWDNVFGFVPPLDGQMI